MFNLSKDLVSLSFQVNRLSFMQTVFFGFKLSVNLFVLSFLVSLPFYIISNAAVFIDLMLQG
jgi:hypothetical protein